MLDRIGQNIYSSTILKCIKDEEKISNNKKTFLIAYSGESAVKKIKLQKWSSRSMYDTSDEMREKQHGCKWNNEKS